MHKMIGRFLLFILFLSAISIPFAQLMRQLTKVYKVQVEDEVEKGLVCLFEAIFSRKRKKRVQKQSSLKSIHLGALRMQLAKSAS